MKIAVTIFAEQAQGTYGSIVTLEILPGHGLNINLSPTRETIKKVWLDDPSRIALSFDGKLCQWFLNNQQMECNNEGATVVHLRQIKQINFPNLPRSPDGSTLLTLVTEGASGRSLYQFKIVPTSSQKLGEQYTTVTVVPNPERLRSAVEQMRQTSSSELRSPAPVPNRQAHSAATTIQQTVGASNSPQVAQDALAAAKGLAEAQRQGQINPNTDKWRKATSAINWLRQGSSIEEAASKAELPISFLAKLIEWGQGKP